MGTKLNSFDDSIAINPINTINRFIKKNYKVNLMYKENGKNISKRPTANKILVSWTIGN